MQYLELHEKLQHGTLDFPLEFHHIDEHHPRYIMNYHWHAEYEMIRILSGELDMTLDEHRYEVRRGDLIFVNGGVLHSGMPEDGCVYECLIFDLNPFLKYLPPCAAYIQRILNRSAFVLEHFPSAEQNPEFRNLHRVADEAFDSMKEQRTGYELTAYGELCHFFGLVFEQHLYHESEPTKRKGYRQIIQFRNVVDYIDQHYSQDISLKDLSDAASMSPKYFCRFFRQMTHRTPMDYLNYQRIEHACYQLSTTDTSVTNVAYSCGFNDLSYFIKTFKKYKGVTPGKYHE